MDLNSKLAILDRIYGVYDEFAANLNIACKKYCAGCCTHNVTMTTLEGYLIVKNIISYGQSSLFENIEKATTIRRFQPQTTTNRLADICMQGKDPPKEENDYLRGICPLLKDNQCSIYRVRPFGCRCFVSKHDCREKGYAEVDSLVLTVHNLFLQFIENVDFQGFSGNLIDILTFMASKKNRHNYKIDTLENPDAVLIPNMRIKVLMIPPEHRVKIMPILKDLQSIR